MKNLKYLLMAAVLPALSPAATIYYDNGGAGVAINTAENWDNDAVPNDPANDYVVDIDVFVNFSNNAAVNPFLGNSLTFTTSNTLNLQNEFPTVNQLNLGAGAILNGNRNLAGDVTLQGGDVDILSQTYIRTNGANMDGKNFNIDSTLSGAGPIAFQLYADDSDILFNDATVSTWVGSISIDDGGGTDNGIVDFSDNHDLNTSRMGNLFMQSTQALLNFDQNFTFQNVNINGTVLGQGVYTYADLQGIAVGAGTAADYFVDGGIGSTINVIAVPEPSTFGLLAIGAVMLRRRFRKRS